MSTVRRSSMSRTISASHQLTKGSACGPYLHGHDYFIRLWGTIPDVAWDVIGEFDLRHLNDMLPVGEPTVEGLAGYLAERLMIHGVSEVEVHESITGRGASVSRVPG